jgi:hypothetical protein
MIYVEMALNLLLLKKNRNLQKITSVILLKQLQFLKVFFQ